MAQLKKSSGIEQLISFGGICTFVGMVGDLLTPVGNYTLWCLGVGAAILFAGFVLLKLRGFDNQATKGTISFGAILSAVSVAFLVAAPDPAEGHSSGVLGSKFDWIADAQAEFLGLTRHVERIAEDTANIAGSADRIAKNTEGVFNLNFSSESFAMALESQDRVNIAMHCNRGYRADQIVHLLASRRNDNFSSDSNFAQLQEIQCFDVAALCDTDKWVYQWHDLAPRMDDDRVEALCGNAGISALVEKRSAILQRDAENKAKREAEYQECLNGGGDESFLRTYCGTVHKRRSIF